MLRTWTFTGNNNRGLPQGTPLDPVGFCSNYLDGDHLPLFPFGFGLSYTQFEYSNLELVELEVPLSGTIEAIVELKNTGAVSATEIVQVYVRDLYASLTRPVRELKEFRRVTLEAGETQLLSFSIPVESLSFCDNTGIRILEPGEFEIWIGGDSRCELSQKFTVI